MTHQDVLERIAVACRRVGRDESEITLVAISKTKTPEEIRVAYDAGQRVFGENRAQELAEKAPLLPDDVEWHFVGALQSNKTRMVRPTVALLHSMDRDTLATAWLKGMGHPPPVLVQVNIGSEPQKAGVAVEEAGPFAERLLGLGMDVRGLMAIPPLPESSEDSRRYFSQLRELRDTIASSLPSVIELSMGMSDDFEVAIEEGASIIRVGRAIFGPRN